MCIHRTRRDSRNRRSARRHPLAIPVYGTMSGYEGRKELLRISPTPFFNDPVACLDARPKSALHGEGSTEIRPSDRIVAWTPCFEYSEPSE